MDSTTVQAIGAFLSPAVLAGIIVWTNNITNRRIEDLNISLNTRIDDVRNQMQREHDALSKKVDKLLEST